MEALTTAKERAKTAEAELATLKQNWQNELIGARRLALIDVQGKLEAMEQMQTDLAKVTWDRKAYKTMKTNMEMEHNLMVDNTAYIN